MQPAVQYAQIIERFPSESIHVSIAVMDEEGVRIAAVLDQAPLRFPRFPFPLPPFSLSILGVLLLPSPPLSSLLSLCSPSLLVFPRTISPFEHLARRL